MEVNVSLAGSQIILKGPLKKKSPKGIAGLHAWQKRFFFLFDTSLAYGRYDDLQRVSGVIPLSEVGSIDTVVGKPTRIRITVFNRQFDLDASTQEDAENWFAALTKCWTSTTTRPDMSSLSPNSVDSSKLCSQLSAPSPMSGFGGASTKFWKASSSGFITSSMSTTLDNLTAPTGVHSRAFTPINMDSIQQHSGHFKAIDRSSARRSSKRRDQARSILSSDPFGDSKSTHTSDEASSSVSSAWTDSNGLRMSVAKTQVSSVLSPNLANFLKRNLSQSAAKAAASLPDDDIIGVGDVGYADFERIEKVAETRIGTLYRAVLKANGGEYLLQIVMKRDDGFRMGVDVIRAMMKPELHHPFLSRLMFSGSTPDRSWAAYTSTAACQNLLQRLRLVKRLDEDVARRYVAQITLLLTFLHLSGRSCQNLRPEYIGLDQTNTPILLDFEHVAISSANESANLVLPSDQNDSDLLDEFWTPELISGNGESTASDWWRLGSLLYELLVGFPPFRAKTREELVRRISLDHIRYPPFVSEPARDLIDKLMTRDPKHRLGVDLSDILGHDFFVDVDWAMLHWKGLTRNMKEAAPNPPVRVKVKVKEGTELPATGTGGIGRGALELAVRLSYGNQSWSTLPDLKGLSQPSWNAKFQFQHDQIAAAHNANLKFELCSGSIPMAFAHELVDLGIRGTQKKLISLCNTSGAKIISIGIDVKVKDEAAKSDVIDDIDHLDRMNVAVGRHRNLRRSITSAGSFRSGRWSRRASVLSIARPLRRQSTLLESVSVKLSGKLRSLVSKNKIRFQLDGFDLDLTYLTSRMIVMGFPSTNLEGVFRNPMEEVQRFIKTYHEGHCRVINLCSERSYDPACFDHNVAQFPFNDHSAPPLKMVLEFCRDVKAYLDSDPQNVVAIHCKAGKGRSGVMSAAYLLYTGQSPTADNALAVFAERRTADGKGVTVPSQIRSVYTFEKLLQQTGHDRHPFAFNSSFRSMTVIRFSPEPDLSPLGGCDPFCRIYRRDKLIYDSALSKISAIRPGKHIVDLAADVVVNGDTTIIMYHNAPTGKKIMFSAGINIDFIDNDHVILDKDNLDKAARSQKFAWNFRVELFLKMADQGAMKASDKYDEDSLTIDQASSEETRLTEDELMLNPAYSSQSSSSMQHHTPSDGATSIDIIGRRKRILHSASNPQTPSSLAEVDENQLDELSSAYRRQHLKKENHINDDEHDEYEELDHGSEEELESGSQEKSAGIVEPADLHDEPAGDMSLETRDNTDEIQSWMISVDDD